ncbi:MAG: hypothetical protein ACRDBO_09640 [Lachnospiraceae bacterium]
MKIVLNILAVVFVVGQVIFVSSGFINPQQNDDRESVVHWDMSGDDIDAPYTIYETKLYGADTPINGFFFPMKETSETIKVRCEMNWMDTFEGTANLKINKLSGTNLEYYYEIILDDLVGTCGSHNDINDLECEFTSAFPIGYFYVAKDNIYMMSYETGFLDVFKEFDVFPPPQEYIDRRVDTMQAAGEHSGYFSYRLVCSEQGVEDVFGDKQDGAEAGVPDGMIRDEHYHNTIEADGDERRYHLWPDENIGTYEFTHMTWKENQGMISYSSWSGALKDYISFEIIGEVHY